MLNRILAALLALFLAVPAFAESDDITRLYTFSPGGTIQSAQMNAEFNQLINTVNEKVGRAVDQTVSGVNTFSGNNIHSGNNTFSGTNTHSGTETFSNAAGVTTNTITERTAASGVTIDSVLLKDGMATLSGTPTVTGQLGYASNLFRAHNGTSALYVPLLTTPSGNGSKVLAVNSGGTGWEYIAAPVFTSSYSSSAQTITSGGTVTLAHGLAGAPKLITAYIKCIDAGGDGGWEQNDEVYVSPSNFIRSTSTPHGFVVTRDATNIIIRFASDSNVFYILNEGDGTGSNLTNTKWQLYVQGYY